MVNASFSVFLVTRGSGMKYKHFQKELYICKHPICFQSLSRTSKNVNFSSTYKEKRPPCTQLFRI